MEKEFTHRLKDQEGLTSPASKLPSFELKMLQQHIHGANLQRLGDSLPHRRKELMLIRFLKHRRNQPVEVFYRAGGELQGVIGKVHAIGRDFAALTTLRERIWIPYEAIESAQTPYGVPEVSGSHQHVLLDDALRSRLLTNFGRTVAGQEALRRQFFEESLWANLKDWRGTRVRAVTDGGTYVGRIATATPKDITLVRGFWASFRRTRTIPLRELRCLRTVRAASALVQLGERLAALARPRGTPGSRKEP
ncbi:hypothetical protein [Paenibacillus sp.]|uniref:hypothetical protein n=1 Tax=Paenibacillus sp. TaxID=58172 RepID=UPI002D4C502B|nr:hypothetical protein [Paenibacillus sp.]HZG55959.1 hypothetical protein [Paenibacillus sp.]